MACEAKIADISQTCDMSFLYHNVENIIRDPLSKRLGRWKVRSDGCLDGCHNVGTTRTATLIQLATCIDTDHDITYYLINLIEMVYQCFSSIGSAVILFTYDG